MRDARWSEAVPVGSLAFVEKVKSEPGIRALHRELEQVDGTYVLRESGEAYRDQFDSNNEALRPENTLSWESITELAELSVDPAHLRFETLPPPRRLIPARGQGSCGRPLAGCRRLITNKSILRPELFIDKRIERETCAGRVQAVLR